MRAIEGATHPLADRGGGANRGPEAVAGWASYTPAAYARRPLTASPGTTPVDNVMTSGRSLQIHSRVALYGQSKRCLRGTPRKTIIDPGKRVRNVCPVKTCSALRPRWCPERSPSRLQDCCLPARGNRRLSLLTPCRDILVSTPIFLSGLHHATCLLAFPPASYAHCWVCTWRALLACWRGFGQVGLEPSVLTHWVTTTNLLGLRPVPRSRAYLGATTTTFGGM
jgi:hypothetical protein